MITLQEMSVFNSLNGGLSGLVDLYWLNIVAVNQGSSAHFK